MDDNKVCTKCNRELPLVDFVKDNRTKDGRATYCCSCRKIYRNKYRSENLDRVREQEYRWRSEHRDMVLLQRKRSYQNNRDTADATIKKWRKDHLDKVHDYYRKYYGNNHDEIRERIKVFRDANRERINEENRLYKMKHPDRYRDYCENRRARIKNQFIEDVNRLVVFERDNGVCHICGERVDGDNWHLDHIVPISAGGEHSYANTSVSHPSCNMQKGRGI